ncbi:hypothetical protein FXO38_20315 [Capsicum annuum]|uniref:Uncharacterized protein n=1 Tax=Capsicum annuum TaxID=4072 RepID=A0A2G2YNQ3_CAPAN|nr:hypothetical protein FXO38_20315 [Capsicum annuum]PHT71372.1 hypothetical protein T459_26476 [Capsicum annuum]
MAQYGNSVMRFLLAIAMVIIVMLLFSSTVMGQDTAVAPTPPMENGMDSTGDGFALPVSEALVCFSVLFSMLIVMSQ